MRRLVAGVIGHVDHGKTALTLALTGMNTDRLAEEQARGISIALGFAHLRVGDADIDLIDMPGHERFVRTMVAGAAGIGAVLLVVDAQRGIMPQTREHLDVAALLGVRRAIIAISRADLATLDETQATADDVAHLVTSSGLQAGPPIVCSARTLAGIEQLKAALAHEAAIAAPPPDDGAPCLPIDRAFSVAGHGTVVTGTLRGGRITAGETLELTQSGIPARIRTLQVHGARVASAEPGQRVAVNLRGLEPADAPRGALLAATGALTATRMISVHLRSVAGTPLATGRTLRLLAGTDEVDARLRLLDCDVLEPGATAFAQLRTARPIALPARLHFVLRAISPPLTLAGGVVLDPATVRARRHAPGVIARLASLHAAAPDMIVRDELARTNLAGATIAQLARLAAVGPAQIAAALHGSGAIVARSHAISAAAFTRLQATLPTLLAAHPDGLPASALYALLPTCVPALVDEAAARLVAAGTLARQGALVRVPRHAHDAAQSQLAQRQAAQIAEHLRRAGLCPPDAQTLAPDHAARRLLDGLIRAGIVVRATDRVQKRDILFHRDAIESARRQLRPLLEASPLLVSEIGAALGISRKYSVPLLEHFDSVQFTRRVEERRTLAKQA